MIPEKRRGPGQGLPAAAADTHNLPPSDDDGLTHIGPLVEAELAAAFLRALDLDDARDERR
jgi:hypothetical protein